MELDAAPEGHKNMTKVLEDKGFAVKQITKSEAMQIKRDSETGDRGGTECAT